MKFLSTFKITKGFDTWLEMYKDIEPDLNELGIKILWAGTNDDETKVYDVTEVKDPSKCEVQTQRPEESPTSYCMVVFFYLDHFLVKSWRFQTF